MQNSASGHNFVCDLCFIAFAACYALLALRGIILISADGAILDSDLQTYAQGMAGAAHPELFAADPMLRNPTAANSIPNLERALAYILAPPDRFATGLLRAGAAVIFMFYTAWYLFGRVFFKSPALSALLSLLAGITVWIGWGTFWGVTHSDPVPRVFYAAIFPLLLLMAFYAINKRWLRPLAMFCTGCSMWVHGINALNCGAMFFAAFVLIKAPHSTWKTHLVNCGICLVAFLGPVLFFLWPSLMQPEAFGSADLEIFRQFFNLRWSQDYVDFGGRILEFLNPRSPVCWLLLAGLAACIVTAMRGNAREKVLCKMYGAFAAALVAVTIFCYFESILAAKLGRLPMGHELVRGLRFLVPMSWLMIVCATSCLLGVWARRTVLAIIAALLLVFTVDRQYEAAQYALAEISGFNFPLAGKAGAERLEAEKYRELLENIERIVPRGQAIYSSGEDMAIRYLALRPLIHTFKDGFAYFYNKDLETSKQWLNYERLRRARRGGFVDGWLESGAPWLLCRDSDADRASVERYGDPVLEKYGWLLVRKKS